MIGRANAKLLKPRFFRRCHVFTYGAGPAITSEGEVES